MWKLQTHKQGALGTKGIAESKSENDDCFEANYEVAKQKHNKCYSKRKLLNSSERADDIQKNNIRIWISKE